MADISSSLIGTEEWSNEEKRGQVYLATHDGEGNPLSAANRSFISFSWGGKNIEDFSLIATIDGDRLTRNTYAEFEDLVTNYDIIDGQLYWGSTYAPNSITFTLSTDGITEQTFHQFRNWFKPGITRELILSELPNRAIQARVSSTPSFSMLPFETEQTVKIGSTNSYNVKTTLWKGDITLSFVMDDPFWYNIIEYYTDNDEMTEDTLKVILEDGIPHETMLQVDCFLAGGKYFKKGENDDPNEISSFTTLGRTNSKYIYYCGTGKNKPILTFSLESTFDSNDFINIPGNSYAGTPYNTITIRNQDESVFKSEFKFTTPGILTSYNQAVKILTQDFSANDSIIELRAAFRDSITDFYVRSFAMGICDLALEQGLNLCDTSTSALTQGFSNQFITYLKQMFLGENGTSITSNYIFNSETGSAEVSIDVYMLESNGEEGVQIISEPVNIKENVGDMARSTYLIIDSRTLPTNGEITSADCLLFESDCDLSSVGLFYNYMYL